MHLVMIGGSDAGISAALRARELDPGAEVSVVVADAYPNFSICGIPYYVSGEVTHWRNLAHRTTADLEATGMSLRLDTTARRIDVAGRKLLVTTPDGARGAARLRQADRRHRRGPGPPPDPGRRAWRPSAPMTVCTCCTRWATRSPSCAPWRRPDTGHRGDRRRRVHRPGDGRRPHHPRPARHPDGTAARGAAHRRSRARPARPRPARRPWRRGPDRHHGPADHPHGAARRDGCRWRPPPPTARR